MHRCRERTVHKRTEAAQVSESGTDPEDFLQGEFEGRIRLSRGGLRQGRENENDYDERERFLPGGEEAEFGGAGDRRRRQGWIERGSGARGVLGCGE
jgi:hypothetical protein